MIPPATVMFNVNPVTVSNQPTSFITNLCCSARMPFHILGHVICATAIFGTDSITVQSALMLTFALNALLKDESANIKQIQNFGNTFLQKHAKTFFKYTSSLKTFIAYFRQQKARSVYSNYMAEFNLEPLKPDIFSNTSSPTSVGFATIAFNKMQLIKEESTHCCHQCKLQKPLFKFVYLLCLDFHVTSSSSGVRSVSQCVESDTVKPVYGTDMESSCQIV